MQLLFITLKPNSIMRLSIFLWLVFIWACSSAKESIHDRLNQETVGGFGNKGYFLVGKTDRNDISLAKEEDWNKLGILLYFDAKSSRLKGIEVRDTTRRFATSRGIMIGDSLSTVRRIYGKPISQVVDMGNNGNVHWEWKGLFYPNFLFLTDSAHVYVTGYYIGKDPWK